MVTKGMIWRRVMLACLALAATPAGAAYVPGLSGKWARDDGAVRIAIAPCGTNYCAVNIWVANPQGREHVGDELIMALQPVSASMLHGQAFDVRRGLHFSMNINVQNNVMTTSGCVLMGLLCKNAGWTRVN